MAKILMLVPARDWKVLCLANPGTLSQKNKYINPVKLLRGIAKAEVLLKRHHLKTPILKTVDPYHWP